MTKRILSGIKPTGDVHLGGYLGAMKQWSLYQTPDNEVFFFIADLHALNVRPDPQALHSRTLDLVAWLLALGIDPQQNPIFIQSQVSAHAELNWILNNYTTMGELSRMTQYKDKASSSGAAGQLVALFNYPVLMAADILLYDADEVPVGDDQTQHVELTRDIATRFNNIYGKVLTIPAFSKPKTGARVMMLDDPTKKMSKSEAGDGCIYLLDDAATINQKILRAVTDSVGVIQYDKAAQPGVSNLLEIQSGCTGNKIDTLVDSYSGKRYGDLKQAVSEAVIQELMPIQEKFRIYRSNESGLFEVLQAGRKRAGEIADKKMVKIKTVLGLL